MERIYIVGFMGTGKSTVGKLIAEKLNKKFIEMDELIEERESQKIKNIFAKKGEAYFRTLEHELLKEISMKIGLVVSCGGGLVCNEKNLSLAKKTGTVISLMASPSIIYERTKNNEDRPLLNVDKPLDKIKELLDKRLSFYNRAHYVINTEGKLPEKISEEIINLLNNG